jgi:hypothetical protein
MSVTIELGGKVGQANSAIERGVDRLIRLTTDPDEPVAAGAIASLIHLGRAAVGRLSRALDSRKDAALRLQLIRILGVIGTTDPRPVVLVLYLVAGKTSDEAERRAIESALGVILEASRARPCAGTEGHEATGAETPRRAPSKHRQPVVIDVTPVPSGSTSCDERVEVDGGSTAGG